jgi:type II secretory pathway component GspD/PulD (secretin)
MERITLLAVWWWAGLVLAGAAVVESKVFTIGDADPREVEEAVKSTLSPKGKTVLLIRERKLLVQDEPEYLPMAEAIIAQFNAPRPNVRVEVMFQEDGAWGERGLEVRGRVGGRDISVGNRPGPNGVEIGAVNRRTTTSSTANQFLVVQSGRTASIRVAREVPFVDYFYNYALGLGYITGAQTRWRSIGTQMAVTPRVRGNLVDVELYPQITALVDARQEIVEFRELATVVTVASGHTVQVGGFQGASEEFNRNFFGGGGRSRGSQTSSFSLRATVQ